MSILSLIIIIALILLALAALKFLVGAARTIISLALIVIAISFLIYVLTGNDPFGVTAAATDAVGKAVNLVT
jgi:hypothetical protein